METRSRLRFLVGTVLFVLLMGMDGCDPAQPGEVLGVVINEGDVTLVVGDTQSLTVTVSTTGNASRDVRWSSSHDDVANVTAAGLVTAISEGAAQITATSVADASKTDSVTVTVVATHPDPEDDDFPELEAFLTMKTFLENTTAVWTGELSAHVDLVFHEDKGRYAGTTTWTILAASLSEYELIELRDSGPFDVEVQVDIASSAVYFSLRLPDELPTESHRSLPVEGFPPYELPRTGYTFSHAWACFISLGHLDSDGWVIPDPWHYGTTPGPGSVVAFADPILTHAYPGGVQVRVEVSVEPRKKE